MELNFEEQLAKITEFIRSEANTKTVVGEQFELGEFICVPVIGVGLGFGGGGGTGDSPKSGKGGGGGAGAGLGIEPIGFLVTRQDQISFVKTSKSGGLAEAFEKVPDIIDKMVNKSKAEKAASV